MKLKRLSLEGFRAFSQRETIELDSDIVIISGPNGQGKTSILDAILWCISGTVVRLKGQSQDIISLYSETGEARVALTLQDGEDREMKVTRTCDPDGQSLRLEGRGDPLDGAAALEELGKILTAGPFHQSAEQEASKLAMPSLAEAFTRSVYLQQDLVRKFVDADSDSERYESLARLFGTGHLTQLQVELEKDKANWTAATNRKHKETEARKERLSDLQSEMHRLEGTDKLEGSKLSHEWNGWWSRFHELESEEPKPPKPGADDAAAQLDKALRRLEARKRACDRGLSALDELLALLRSFASLNPPTSSRGQIQKSIEKLRSRLESLKSSLAQAEERAARERRNLVIEREHQRDLAALAQLALRHLDERCPVCQQTYDRESTQNRLEKLADGPKASGNAVPSEHLVENLAKQIEESQNLLGKEELRLERLERYLRHKKDLQSRLSDAGFEDIVLEDAQKHVLNAQSQLKSQISEWNTLQSEGERLSLSMARAGEEARKESLAKEVSILKNDLESIVYENSERNKTGELAQSMIQGLREASQKIVEDELSRIQDLAQRIYAAIDPHPALREIRLKSWLHYGRGRASTQVRDPDRDITSEVPEMVLSSSQVNALAVSIFLALNLGARSIPIHSAILDDPLQSLDDINVLGLIDLLRRARDRRQLIISTHDQRFATLLERKLRPISDDHSTSVVRIDTWTREGPKISAEKLASSRKMYIVA